MNDVHFETMTDAQQAAEVLAMMSPLNLDGELVAGSVPSHFPLTIRTLLTEPSRGLIVCFLYRDGPVGYALLIPYWSNEFGGTLLFIDELFVIPQARSPRSPTSLSKNRAAMPSLASPSKELGPRDIATVATLSAQATPLG